MCGLPGGGRGPEPGGPDQRQEPAGREMWAGSGGGYRFRGLGQSWSWLSVPRQWGQGQWPFIPCQSAHWPLARLWGCRGERRRARVAGLGHSHPRALTLTLAHLSGLPLLSLGPPSGWLSSPDSPPAPKVSPRWPALVFCLIGRKRSISNYSKITLMCPERH